MFRWMLRVLVFCAVAGGVSAQAAVISRESLHTRLQKVYPLKPGVYQKSADAGFHRTLVIAFDGDYRVDGQRAFIYAWPSDKGNLFLLQLGDPADCAKGPSECAFSYSWIAVSRPSAGTAFVFVLPRPPAAVLPPEVDYLPEVPIFILDKGRDPWDFFHLLKVHPVRMGVAWTRKP